MNNSDDKNNNVVQFDRDFINVLKDLHEEREQELAKQTVVDVEREEDVKDAYQIMSNMFAKNPTVQVGYKLHEPDKGMGFVEVSGRNIIIRDIEAFQQAVDLGGILHVIGQTTGKARLSLTYYGLMKEDDK